MFEYDKEKVLAAIEMLCIECHHIAGDHGWREGDRNDGELIALMHSELSGCLEAMRHGNPDSDHIPAFSGVEEELADVLVRIFDFARARDMDLAGALVEKIEFNRTREYRHGNKTM